MLLLLSWVLSLRRDCRCQSLFFCEYCNRRVENVFSILRLVSFLCAEGSGFRGKMSSQLFPVFCPHTTYDGCTASSSSTAHLREQVYISLCLTVRGCVDGVRFEIMTYITCPRLTLVMHWPVGRWRRCSTTTTSDEGVSLPLFINLTVSFALNPC